MGEMNITYRRLLGKAARKRALRIAGYG